MHRFSGPIRSFANVFIYFLMTLARRFPKVIHPRSLLRLKRHHQAIWDIWSFGPWFTLLLVMLFYPMRIFRLTLLPKSLCGRIITSMS